jgi:hypothetical protein
VNQCVPSPCNPGTILQRPSLSACARWTLAQGKCGPRSENWIAGPGALPTLPRLAKQVCTGDHDASREREHAGRHQQFVENSGQHRLPPTCGVPFPASSLTRDRAPGSMQGGPGHSPPPEGPRGHAGMGCYRLVFRAGPGSGSPGHRTHVTGPRSGDDFRSIFDRRQLRRTRPATRSTRSPCGSIRAKPFPRFRS